MPVIPVNKAEDKKRIIRKKEGGEGGEAQGIADQKILFFFFDLPDLSDSCAPWVGYRDG
jgi:hypothetical protein